MKQSDEQKIKVMEEMLALPRKEFIEINLAWIKEENGGKLFTPGNMTEDGKWVLDPLKCPLHIWVVHNKAKCPKEMASLTATCPLCDNPVCPDCMNHNVEQLSRVTGYLSGVSGWNKAKQQEFVDRTRHNIG